MCGVTIFMVAEEVFFGFLGDLEVRVPLRMAKVFVLGFGDAVGIWFVFYADPTNGLYLVGM